MIQRQGQRANPLQDRNQRIPCSSASSFTMVAGCRAACVVLASAFFTPGYAAASADLHELFRSFSGCQKIFAPTLLAPDHIPITEVLGRIPRSS